MKQSPILVVDDDESIVSTIAMVLDDEGYPVVTAANGEEALACVAQYAPRLILLDMMMPKMDGWAFATAYRTQPGAHAPLIVMTAARDALERAAEIHAVAFIAKPFTLEDLLALIERILSS